MKLTMRQEGATEAAAPVSQDETRWRAVLARDARLDGSFVTGVLTTGIYCRPSCSARRPRRENVRFFDRPEEAERSGFRACLRCRPREAGLARPQADLARRVCRFIESSAAERVTLDAIAGEVGLGP